MVAACYRSRLEHFTRQLRRASIIPVCVSTTSNKINLNRLHNGLVIVEMLPPIDVSQYGKDQVRELAAHCRSIMEQNRRAR